MDKTDIKKAYDAIVSRTEPFFGDLEIPLLWDELKPDMTIAAFLKTLERLCEEVIIDLHPVNDRAEIKRPEFGIPTSLGEIYYVSWRE